MKTKPIGIYIHVPFCLRKCNYCDFCSFDNLDSLTRNKYITRLIEEIKGYKSEKKTAVDTIFFGGGTPTLLTEEEFSLICESLSDAFDISGVKEFTLEANPKTISKEKLHAFKLHGVNRISLGLQSIHENELKILGRIHSFEDFKDAYALVSECGISNINVDVMYGIPEQTKESFKETLSEIIKLKPTHISAYGLILEEKTKFWHMRDKLNFPDEDAECDMYLLACDILSGGGYTHYEVSNYSLPEYSSQHNLKYWRCEEYIGFGVAAHSYFLGRRYANSANLSEYLSENDRNYISGQKLSVEDKKYEYAMLSLRLSAGISLPEYEEKFSESFLCGREEKVKKYANLGYLSLTDKRVALTEKGFYVSNTILADLL